MLQLAFCPVGPESSAEEIAHWIAELTELDRIHSPESDALAGMIQFRMEEARKWLSRTGGRKEGIFPPPAASASVG